MTELGFPTPTGRALPGAVTSFRHAGEQRMAPVKHRFRPAREPIERQPPMSDADPVAVPAPARASGRLKVGLLLPLIEKTMGGRSGGWPELLAYARAAESLGFDSLWLPDHLLFRLAGREEQPVGMWESMTLLAGLAAATSRMTLGTFVANTGFRNPALLAKMAGDDRRDQRRPIGSGPGRRLARARVRGLRIPIRPQGKPLRGSVHDHPLPDSRMGASTSRANTTALATASCGRAARAPTRSR